jgi:polar amino acid transport system substrate-binding protein
MAKGPSRNSQDFLSWRAADARGEHMGKRMVMMACLLGACSFMLLDPQSSWAAAQDEVITLHYMNRPPYMMSKEGSSPIGVVAEPAEEAFKKAKIPFVWEKTPVNRQFALIKANQGLHCAVGFEETALRRKFAKFSEPLYIGQPFIAITSLKVNEKSGVTLKYMLSKYTILAKENYSQGDVVTSLIMESKNKYLTSTPSKHMVRMIAQGHGDFMMLSNEELEYYVQHGIVDPKDIHVLTFSDVNLRFARRIMCNQRVDDRIIQKLNKVIATMKVTPTAFKSVK